MQGLARDARRGYTVYAMHIPPNARTMQAPLSNTSSPPLSVVVSIDVEEEGLFSGHYATSQCSVNNVRELERLTPLFTDLGFPLTLLCSHAVFINARACRTLAYLRDHAGAEIGAHLHHWNTPPLSQAHNAHGPPARTHTLPQDLLHERLHTLLEAGRAFNGAALTAFRMGRWDLKAAVRPMLAQMGLRVDSSVCPLRAFAGGPDHFCAPADPYWPSQPAGTPPLLEVPITQIPTLPALAKAWYACMRKNAMLDSFRFVGALSPNPVWHGNSILRWAARLHQSRGGQVLCLFWHSSEMMPGGSPHTPNRAAADRLYTRIYAYLRWLREHLGARGVTLSSLLHTGAFPHMPAPAHGDW